MENKRLTVGFMIHHLDNDYSKALLKGAAAAARELDVNLAIFPGRSLNSQLDDRKYTAYEYQNNVIYSYVSHKSLDAVVISAGTLGSFVTKEEFRSFVDGFEGLPVVTTENKVGSYPCVRLSGSGIKDIVSHLVHHHGKKHIAFVSGPKGNADADERLGHYIDALGENGLEYDPDMVAYGKFSEYCVDIVGELIDKNAGKIDAICFANDMMCKGGYKAIESRGLRVGDDIAVTGYDDSEVALSLKPMLTTVRADAAKLGSRAVKEAVRLAKGETDGEDINLGSSPVYRSSCGCDRQTDGTISICSMLLNGKTPDDAAEIMMTEFVPQYEETLKKNPKIRKFRDFVGSLLGVVMGSEESAVTESGSFVKSFLAGILDAELRKLVPSEAVLTILRNIKITAKGVFEAQGVDFGRREYIISLLSDCQDIISERIISNHYSVRDDMTFTHFLISNITKDMTIYGNDEEKCFFSIVNNLYRVHMDSSYIYTYESPILHTAKSEWKLPETVYLRAYHDGDKLATVTGEARKISSSDIISNQFTPVDRRRTMVVSPLFMNEEQYGIIVSELDNEYFPYIYSITPQICTAIKLTNLVLRLESSLDAAYNRNNMLSRISMSDELTGIYNRRGFYTFANQILKAPENEGMNAVLIFGDLDNLKKINDTFGHDEGDYAIVSAANFIKSSLRNSDIVARIGGDEFAAFAICGDRDIIAKLPMRIKSIAKNHNLRSDKKFNVTISVGICEIICSPELNIQQFMDRADVALYDDKKNKCTDILKKEN